MQTYLFEFSFKEGTINQNIYRWMKETKTDYFYRLNKMYADIYGIGEYYEIVPEHIGEGNTFEVYADTDKVERRNALERLFPQIAKAVSVQEPIRRVKVFFPDGEKLVTDIRLCSKKAKEFYLGNTFGTKNPEAAEKIEFIA